MVYSILKSPAIPDLSHFSPEQAQQALAVHKQLIDQWRESMIALFDLLVTRTVLPIITLLLGYLCGKKE